MTSPRNAVYVLVAAISLTMAACQPNDESAPLSMKSLDESAAKIVAQIDKPADNGGGVNVTANASANAGGTSANGGATK